LQFFVFALITVSQLAQLLQRGRSYIGATGRSTSGGCIVRHFILLILCLVQISHVQANMLIH
jgi:hypothetical protein